MLAASSSSQEIDEPRSPDSTYILHTVRGYVATSVMVYVQFMLRSRTLWKSISVVNLIVKDVVDLIKIFFYLEFPLFS